MIAILIYFSMVDTVGTSKVDEYNIQILKLLTITILVMFSVYGFLVFAMIRDRNGDFSISLVFHFEKTKTKKQKYH